MSDVDILVRLREMTAKGNNVANPVVPKEAADEIERLRAERDELRRMLCVTLYTDKEMQRNHARLCGWDCFKEEC
jgi:hypothetical protein